jgi:Cu(I)/Ag(I) efflux system membrane fusion protein
LRFIALLVVIGLVIVNWPTITAYYERWMRPARQQHAHGDEFEYFCPMHPAIVRDSPKEKCPICFMPLSKRKKGEGEGTLEALPPGIANRVQLTPYKVVQANVQTWKVAYVPLVKEIITVGSVEFNEREMKQVAARVKGRIDKLVVNETGEWVSAKAELALLYSPDLLVTVRTLLDARSSNNASAMAGARERLKLWGIDDKQIAEIESTGTANTHLKIRSPIKGHVIKKYVKEGQYVEEGSPLYDIVDLATVWIQGQVYEDDMAFLPAFHRPLKQEEADREGLAVVATIRGLPGETFDGKLTFVFPHVDQDTRTVIARFELPNPGHKLRPGSSATVKIRVPPAQVPALAKALDADWVKASTAQNTVSSLFALGALQAPAAPLIGAAEPFAALQRGRVLAVPDSAVIDTGHQQIVYREVTPYEYEGVLVDLGPRMAGPDNVTYYPVLRGLKAGDMIVTAGSFLIDAETRLNPAAGSIYYGGSGAGTKASSTVRPSTPEDEEAKISAALANLPSEDRRLAEAQRFCPIQKDTRLGSMGTPIKMVILNQPVFLCCSGCVKGAQNRPKETLAKVTELKANTAAPGH